MIPAEEDREHPLGDYGCCPIGDLVADSPYGGEVLDLRLGHDGLGDGHPCVAEVGNPVAEVLQACLDAGVTDGAWSHIYASPVLAEVHRHTEDPNRLAFVFKQRQSLPNDGDRPPPRSVLPVFV